MGYPINYGYGHMATFGILGGLLHILFWILAIAIVIRLIRGSRGGWYYGRCGQGMGSNSAINILSERYAKGEINKEEYEQKKKDILS